MAEILEAIRVPGRNLHLRRIDAPSAEKISAKISEIPSENRVENARKRRRIGPCNQFALIYVL